MRAEMVTNQCAIIGLSSGETKGFHHTYNPPFQMGALMKVRYLIREDCTQLQRGLSWILQTGRAD